MKMLKRGRESGFDIWKVFEWNRNRISRNYVIFSLRVFGCEIMNFFLILSKIFIFKKNYSAERRNFKGKNFSDRFPKAKKETEKERHSQ